MPPGVEIQPDRAPEPSATIDPTAPVTASFAAIRAYGSDPDGNVEVTLDGTGRLVDLVVAPLALDDGRRGVQRSVRAAFDAAHDDLDRIRREQAEAMLAAGTGQLTALTDELRRLGDHADARLQEAFTRLRETADRVAGA